MASPYVFTRLETMRPLYKEFAYEVLRAARARSGVAKACGFHDFRHFRATEWLRNGVQLPDVQEWLGHHSITITEIYLHYLEDEATDAHAAAEQRELAALQAEKNVDIPSTSE